MTNNITLSQAIKDLYTANTNLSVKDLLKGINENESYSHLKDKAHYRAVYNTLKRISGTPTKKAPKLETASIVLDLTITPTETVKGVVYSKGR
jgi:hypothetical protein